MDLQADWDFKDPAGSEARFRARLATASLDERLELETQIARTYGLRRRFGEARAVLAAVAPHLGSARSPVPRVRYWLEYGRTFVSAVHPDEDRTADATAAANDAYRTALELAREHALDALAIDALHMLAIVETEPGRSLERNREALAIVERSSQPDARRWGPSIRNNIGMSLHGLGRLEEALEEFRANVEPTDGLGDAGRSRIARWMVAWILRLVGRVDEAIAIQESLERACAEAGAQDPYVHEELALLHRLRGDESEAVRHERLAASARRPA